jgi:GntR family transcriptional regulator
MPLHAQVQSIVRGMLERPPWRDGAVLPDEISLARQLAVSRGTVRQALGALAAEGLVERRRAQGTRKAPTAIRGRLAAFRSFSREMAEAGISVRLLSGSLRRVAADTEVAEALGIQPGRRIQRVERLRGDDDGAIVWFASWLRPGLLLPADADLSRPLYDLLEAVGGPQPHRSAETLTAICADTEVAAELGCPPGSPLLERRRRVLDTQGRCFEYAVVRYRSERFRLQLDVDAEPRP